METLTHIVECTTLGTSYCEQYTVTQEYVGLHQQTFSLALGFILFFLTAMLVMYAFRNS
jgi:high-affinity Fe2+/Pb2+ permease